MSISATSTAGAATREAARLAARSDADRDGVALSVATL
jgi:hypothetical protein